MQLEKFTRQLLPSLIISLLLTAGYLVLNKEILTSLIRPQTIPLAAATYHKETLEKYHTYQATNIFDPGFATLMGPDFHTQFTLSSGSPEKTIQLSLPKRFQQGMVHLKSKSTTTYAIEVSTDLKNWKRYEYPGYNYQVINLIPLEEEDYSDSVIYLKFIPPQKGKLEVLFDELQYISTALPDLEQYKGSFLFYPDVDVDYNGNLINIPGIIYGKKP